jgi:alpha-N-arabinofuranosidase
VLSGDATSAFNEPDAPSRVAPQPLETELTDGILTVRMPPHSFATVELELI